jgi:hypothetical protein
MPISSLQSCNWIPPFVSQSNGDKSPLPSVAAQGNAAPAGTSTTKTNPFQQLAADVQAILVQGQNATTSGGSATASDPTQQLATDLKSIYAQLQGTQADGDPAAKAGQPNATEQGHHHSHHHDAGGSTSASSAATSSDNIRSVSNALAADIMHALQAYASSTSSSSSSSTIPGLTV